ncbi:flavin reductase family protein [Streptomyces sp. PU-14G]|uniref:flavin reductase family protein n=1 Tax=Streptomyces sp. PU-14G TaxID=2800808 RepID=UPI0034E01EE4
MGEDSMTAAAAHIPRPSHTGDQGAPAPSAQRAFRHVLGHFASGITVITAPGEGGGHSPAGFTCQSFSALSLDPPMVAFLVGRTSATWPRIARAGVFCVNILAAGQSQLCRAFARSGADKFAGVGWDASRGTGSPVLRGALAWIDCVIDAVHTGGDHFIVTGRVQQLSAAPQGAPLLFYRGAVGGFRA